MRSLILALFVVGAVPFILMRPYVGLLVWSWFGYMNPHRMTWGWAYSFSWVQWIALLTLVSLVASKENKSLRPYAVTILLILFFLWTTVTSFFALDVQSAWVTWEEFGKILIMVFVTLMLVKSKARMEVLVWVIVVSLGFFALKGGLFTLLTGGSHHVFGPPDSFIADNNGLAQAFCMVLPLMRYLQLQASKKYMKLVLGGVMFLTCIATLGTYSRGGLITLAVVVAALFLKSRKQFVLILGFVLIAGLGYQFMPAKWEARMATIQNASSVTNVETRVQSWKFAANVALHSPLIGGGYNVNRSATMWMTYAPAGAHQRAVHSIYFRVLGEHGFPGLLLFLGLLFASWRSCSKVRKKTRNSETEKWAFDLASMLQVSLLAYMTGGLATTLSYFDLSYQLMAMCALVNGILSEGDQRLPRRLQANG